MSFCRILIRLCFFVTNHGSEITLFLLYIVNLVSDVNNCFDLQSQSQNSNITFSLKGVPRHWKKYYYFAIRFKQTHVAVCCILLIFSWWKEIIRTPSSLCICFLFGISEAAGCVSVTLCERLTVQSWKNEHPLHLKKVKITSSIESRLLSLRVCDCMMWLWVVLYVYMCFHTCRSVRVCIYMYVINAHVIYTLWCIHTPMWTQQILYCFGTKYTTTLGVCL